MYIYICMYGEREREIHVYTCVYIYIYIYIYIYTYMYASAPRNIKEVATPAGYKIPESLVIQKTDTEEVPHSSEDEALIRSEARIHRTSICTP